MSAVSELLDRHGDALLDQRVAILGRLAGMPKRDAMRVIRQHQGVCVDHPAEASLLVVGDNELPLAELTGDQSPLDEAVRTAIEDGRLEVFSETQLWQHLGFVDGEHDARRLYTPAMLAELLGTSVAVVRRWHRKGLIVPVREVHRLPYFDFQEVATARHLAELLAAGCSPQTIERKLAALARVLPKIDRPLAQLSIIVEGKQILLRQGDGLIEPGGQLRFDFESTEDDVTAPTSDPPAPESISFSDVRSASLDTPEAMAAAAAELEDEGRLDAAADMYRALLASTGPLAEVNFNLAELLYRQGELAAARERYYMAVELDEDYVEARANLGCVLAELGETELAIAAFEGALRHHGDYPDAHYHLARTLDEQGQREQAESHWRTFLTLAADSPWAEEARVRLALGE